MPEAAVVTPPASGSPPAAPAVGAGSPPSPPAAPALGGGAPVDAGGKTLLDLKDTPLGADSWRLHMAGGDSEAVKQFESFTDLAGVGKAIRDLRQRVSDPNVLRVPVKPADDAPQEAKDAYAKERRAYYDKLGVPASADKYEIKLPDGFKATPDFEANVGVLKEFGLEAGLSTAQVQGLTDAIIARDKAVTEAFEADGVTTENKNIEALRGQWGGEFDANWKLAEAAGTQFFGEGFAALMNLKTEDGARLGTNPVMIAALAGIAREFQNDPLFNRVVAGDMDAATIDARIEAIDKMRDGTRAGAAAYDAAVAEKLKLLDTKKRIAAAPNAPKR